MAVETLVEMEGIGADHAHVIEISLAEEREAIIVGGVFFVVCSC